MNTDNNIADKPEILDAKAKWRASWSATRSHWRMMKSCGRWDGKSQFFGEWTRYYTYTVYGKRGKELAHGTKRHVGKFDRYEVAERWALIKRTLSPGMSATITLNGRVSKTFKA